MRYKFNQTCQKTSRTTESGTSFSPEQPLPFPQSCKVTRAIGGVGNTQDYLSRSVFAWARRCSTAAQFTSKRKSDGSGRSNTCLSPATSIRRCAKGSLSRAARLEGPFFKPRGVDYPPPFVSVLILMVPLAVDSSISGPPAPRCTRYRSMR